MNYQAHPWTSIQSLEYADTREEVAEIEMKEQKV
jgi:hypothetical protein